MASRSTAESEDSRRFIDDAYIGVKTLCPQSHFKRRSQAQPELSVHRCCYFFCYYCCTCPAAKATKQGTKPHTCTCGCQTKSKVPQLQMIQHDIETHGGSSRAFVPTCHRTCHNPEDIDGSINLAVTAVCDLPMMPFRGVLSSCDTMDMNSSLACMLTLRSSICFNLHRSPHVWCGNIQKPRHR